MGVFTDIIPAKARKYVYAAVALVALVVAAWQASDGNWDVAAGSLLASLVNALAHGNTNPDSDSDQSQ